MITRRARWLLAVLLLPAIAESQALRGVVVDRADRPVAGVVLQLMDSVSSVAARSLSNALGEFSLAAARPGTYRVRTMRIGFRPVVSDPIALASGKGVVQRFILNNVAFSLDTVRVVSQSSCRAAADSGAATFAAFEQVRTALTATQITGSARMVAMTTLTYERTLDPSSRRIRKQTSVMRTEYGAQPWLSLDPATLRRVGYVVPETDGGTTYHAPGLDMLLSDVFIEDHCFRLTRDKDRMGIEFEPTPDRRRIPEIRGTLWLDRASSELRALELRYVNIESDVERVAGSDMEFVRMSNGAWAISRWSIRMPRMEQRLRSASLGGTAVFVSELRVAGGEIVLARVGRDTVWSQPPRILLGTVVDSVTGSPIADAQVSLDGTPLFAQTDSRGAFRLSGVLLGEYTLQVHTPSLDSASAVHQSQLSFTDPEVRHSVRVPTAQQIAGILCPGRVAHPGIVIGSVRMRTTSTGSPDIRIRAEWDVTSVRQTSSAVQISRRIQHVETRSDSRGSFRLCGAPVGSPLTVSGESDSAATEPVELKIPLAGRFARAELVLDKLAPGLSIFAGVVLTDSTRQPIADVDVRFPALGKQALTNERGVFRIANVPAGTHQLVVRRIGYGHVDTSITLVAGKLLEQQIVLPRAMVLETVATVASAGLPGFDEHRKLGLGHFFTREQITPREGMHLSSIMGDVQGAKVWHGAANAAYLMPNRARPHGCRDGDTKCHRENNVMRPSGGGPLACWSQVYLDNQLMNPGRPTEPFDLNTIPPNTIEALEYYVGSLQTPHKYNNANADCGVLVIWTRRAR